jgi:hypothetical protein
VPAGYDDELEQVAERDAVRVEEVVVRQVRPLAEHEQGRHPSLLERWRLRCQLTVGRDDGRLAVAVAQAPVVARVDVRGEVLDDELARGEVELALDVALLDQLLERDVGLLGALPLGGGERDVAGDEDRRVEQDELLNELGRARSELEREPAAEGVPDQDRLPRPTVSTTAPRCVSRLQGGSQDEWPWPRRSGATTW